MLTEQIRLEFFENGYGISVITGSASYSNASKPYEAAVLKGTRDKFELCCDTPITNDVLGYLSSNEVDAIATEIEALPKAIEIKWFCPSCETWQKKERTWENEEDVEESDGDDIPNYRCDNCLWGKEEE